jgi:hypothetical protein
MYLAGACDERGRAVRMRRAEMTSPREGARAFRSPRQVCAYPSTRLGRGAARSTVSTHAAQRDGPPRPGRCRFEPRVDGRVPWQILRIFGHFRHSRPLGESRGSPCRTCQSVPARRLRDRVASGAGRRVDHVRLRRWARRARDAPRANAAEHCDRPGSGMGRRDRPRQRRRTDRSRRCAHPVR